MRACPLHKVCLACHSKHITVNSQKTIQDMKRLNILLLLIGFSFVVMGANSLSKPVSKHLILKNWQPQHRTVVPIPIEVVHEENSIEVRFLENVNDHVIFQIKDLQGNIIYQDVAATFNETEVYEIDLKTFKIGQYEFHYIEEDMTLIGVFEIE